MENDETQWTNEMKEKMFHTSSCTVSTGLFIVSFDTRIKLERSLLEYFNPELPRTWMSSYNSLGGGEMKQKHSGIAKKR